MAIHIIKEGDYVSLNGFTAYPVILEDHKPFVDTGNGNWVDDLAETHEIVEEDK